MLFPQQNSYRSTQDLAGYWRFLPDPDDRGEVDGLPRHPFPDDAMIIGVPGAWNEQLAERGLKNFIGAGWYEVDFQTPRLNRSTHCLVLRIGAADHHARVWLNGIFVGSHRGGYLPFEIDLTQALASDTSQNRLVICVDSRLTMETIPQGIDPAQPPYDSSEYDRRHVFPPTRFDFFPYGGLTRSVQLLVVPFRRITAISLRSALSGRLDVTVGTSSTVAHGSIEVYDAGGELVAGPVPVQFNEGQTACTLHVPQPQLWSPASPYLYAAIVRLQDEEGRECDAYRETFGIREVKIDGPALLLNGEPLYLVGFGKHEDFPIVGRGQFRPAYVRDFELLRWAGANSFRTSHYPYDEEILRLADQLGFLVISEAPAVSLGFCSDELEHLRPLLQTHCEVLTELVTRDHNHPSVIAWSPMNEPNLWSESSYQNETSRQYFRAVHDHLHALDATRPIIAITMAAFAERDVALEACDLIGINRYYGWYTDPGELSKAATQLEQEMDALYAKYGKPVMITECGVDTVEGSHATTPQMFTEEFQTEFLRTYASVADRKPYCAGFHVWNFADFLTPQHHRRVILNRKGVFTRERDPKSAAFFLREHWTHLKRLAATHRPKRFDSSFLVNDVQATRK